MLSNQWERALKFQKKVNNIKTETKKEDETEQESSNDEEEDKDELGDLAAEKYSMNAIKVIYMNKINQVNTNGSSDLPIMYAYYSRKDCK